MKIAILCSGLGHINRGHEVFARGLFDMLRDHLDIYLFKGGGEETKREIVIPNLSRISPCLKYIHAIGSPRWAESIREHERCHIEAVTFAYAALKPLLNEGFDIIHCLEREVCEVIYQHRHLFRYAPRIIFSNGGAIPAQNLPPCDFVQEHSTYNQQRSVRGKAFMIPHGVDLNYFYPAVDGDFRARHGIPQDAFVAISVGTIGYWHKRMDYVIRELSQLPHIYLLIVGQENSDSPAIKALGQELMGGRITFLTLPHKELPQAYAAADVFVLGSLAEAFGIVYIEAMAMGLPVFCTHHPNQRSIVQEGIFVNMSCPGALAAALRDTSAERLAGLRHLGPEIVRRDYDLHTLRERYLAEYQRIATTSVQLPAWTLRRRINANLKNVTRSIGKLFG